MGLIKGDTGSLDYSSDAGMTGILISLSSGYYTTVRYSF